MPKENTKLFDAREFKWRLICRVNKGEDVSPINANTEEQKKKEERKREEGKRIGLYLNEVLPDWRSMRATSLYKYIHDMLKSATNARRSEMELVLKQSAQIIPLMVLFFTAFGYLGFTEFENIIKPMFMDWFDGRKNRYFSNEGDYISIFILAGIAYINILLSITMSLIYAHGYRWQKNWEYHIDYLQVIFGIKLIQAFLGNKMKNALINILIIRFSHFMFMFWSFVGVFPLVLLIFSFFLLDCQKLPLLGFCDIGDMLIFIGAALAIAFFAVSALPMRSIIVTFIEKGEQPGKDTMSINPLPKLSYDEL